MWTTDIRVMLAATTLCLFSGVPIMAADSGVSPSDRVPLDNKMTDLTGGQQGIPDEYATTPVRQGSLTEMTDNSLLNKEVTNKQGETLGKITKVLKDQKTQKEEYVLLEIADSHEVRPLPWAHFKQQGDRVMLNATKDELLPSVNRSDTKDLSPDLAMFMDQIEQKRAESKPQVGRGDGRGTNRPAPATGPMGEQEAAGDLGPRGASPGDAPGFEREGEKKQ
jgi:hypothetical protein